MASDSAVARVFAVPELLEMILLNFDQENQEKFHIRANQSMPPPFLEGITPLFALQRVNTTFRDTIVDSKLLQDRLFFPPRANEALIGLQYLTDSIRRPFSGIRTSSKFTIQSTDFCEPIQRAWDAAKTSPDECMQQSWRKIRVGSGDDVPKIGASTQVPTEILKGTHLEGRKRAYKATFNFEVDTTLGDLFDWQLEIEKRTPEEHLREWRKQNPKEEEFAMSIRTNAFSLLY